MKTNQKTITLMATALFLSACQQADEPQTAPRQPVALQLTSGIAATVTRAYDATWEKDDKIGVFTTAAGTKNTTKSGTVDDANVLYTTTGTSSFTSASPIYLPIDGSDVDVYAYYPYAEKGATGQPVTISNDLTTLTVNLETTQTLVGQKKYDLMTAKTLSSSSPINIDHASTKLLFAHKLSKVIVKLMVGTGYSASDLKDKVSVYISGQPTVATWSPLTQAFTISKASNDITPLTLASGDDDYKSDALYTYRALLMPSDATTNPATTDGTRKIVVVVDNTGGASSTYSYTLVETFVAGQQTTYTLRLDPTGLTVAAAITPWNDVPITPSDPLYEEN